LNQNYGSFWARREIHHGRVMKKMGLASVVDLVRIAEKLGIGRKED
jgi:FixJ family two-component response regulator